MKQILMLSLMFLGFGISSVGMASETMLDNVVLTWKPTDDLGELKKIDCEALRSKRIQLGTLKDGRPAALKNQVGANKENSEKTLPVSTKSDVVEFIRQHLVETMAKIYINLDEPNPEYILNGEIKEYFVEEINTYRGLLVIRFELKKGDTVIWSGLVTGSNKRFGRSYKLDNYMESLSDSIMDFVKEFISNKSLNEKLSAAK